MKHETKKFQHELRLDWYETIQEYADEECTSVRFLINRYILAGLNKHRPPNEKGQYMQGPTRVSGRESTEKGASKESEPLKPKYDCYDDAITAFCSERGPQPMLDSGREEYEEWNKGLEAFVKEFGYREGK